MQFKNSALVATVVLSTFTEASPARFHLDARENETREPKNGQKTTAAGLLGAVAGIAGIAAPFLFSPKAAVPAPAPTTRSIEINSDNTPVSLSTREPKNGQKTAVAGVAAAIAGLAGIAAPFLFSPKAPQPAPAPAARSIETNLSPELTPVSLSTREPKNGQKTAVAGVAAAIAGLAGIAAPFLFSPKAPQPAPTKRSIEANETPFALSTREPKVTLAGSAAGVGALGAIAGAILPFVFGKKAPEAAPAPTTRSIETREPKVTLAGSAAGVGAISALAGAILPFVFGKKAPQAAPAPATRSIEELSSSSLVTRDAAFEISAFRDNVSIANTITLPTPSIGSSATLALDCGNIVVTLRQLEAFTCNFNLPSDMSSGTLTGENPGQALSFEVSGDCVGVEFTATNNCADCVAPLNVDCQGTVDGTDNDVELCATGSTLAGC